MPPWQGVDDVAARSGGREAGKSASVRDCVASRTARSLPPASQSAGLSLLGTVRLGRHALIS